MATHLDGPTYEAREANYFDLIDETLELTPDELALLERNGFVVSDRLAFDDFTTAYGYIFWKDLPVLVTTDSILQVVHQAYSDILTEVEEEYARDELADVLGIALEHVIADVAASDDPRLRPLYRDLFVYLTVPQRLSQSFSRSYKAWPAQSSEEAAAIAEEIETYVALAEAASEVVDVDLLFPLGRPVDFTLFQPRGRYSDSPAMQQYFRTVSWLAHIDFRFVSFDPRTNAETLHLEPLAAAIMLRDAMARSGARRTWNDLDSLLGMFLGQSDNMDLDELDALLTDLGLEDPATVSAAHDTSQWLARLMTDDPQRIVGQPIGRHIDNDSTDSVPPPVSFMLMGPHFAIDSYVLSNLVYDRLRVNGQLVERAVPSPLDVMAAMGNDRAIVHLEDELEKYGYSQNLGTLRHVVAQQEPDYWESSAYNRWLDLLRTLSTPTTDDAYPQSMQTAAWADKMLHTQLASWAQLRHDNILYVKQSFTTANIVCEYPAGYVEPYPEFYAAVSDYAEAARALFESLDEATALRSLRRRSLDHFERLADVTRTLQGMAEKELQLEEFSAEETSFLKSIVQRQDPGRTGCRGPTFRELWDGWYPGLFLIREDNPAMIADVHTNPNTDPNSALYPPRVLHAATGLVATTLFIADTDEGTTLYAGPAFTYFEPVESGWPPNRLTDEDWQARLTGDEYPQAPVWTGSFRLSDIEAIEPLEVGREEED